jgi:hypothetical protein
LQDGVCTTRCRDDLDSDLSSFTLAVTTNDSADPQARPTLSSHSENDGMDALPSARRAGFSGRLGCDVELEVTIPAGCGGGSTGIKRNMVIALLMTSAIALGTDVGASSVEKHGHVQRNKHWLFVHHFREQTFYRARPPVGITSCRTIISYFRVCDTRSVTCGLQVRLTS